MDAGRSVGAGRLTRQDLAAGYSDEFADDFSVEGSPFSGGFDRELARQFGEDNLEAFEEQALARPLSLRSLHWIRRNMSSLRIIVSLQRVTPPDLPDEKPPRKASGS